MDFNKIFSKLPVTLVIVSPEFKILAATDNYLQVTMRNKEDLIGKNILDAFPDNPKNENSRNAPLLRNSLNRVLINKKIDYLDVLRYDIPKPDGSGFDIRYWEATHTPVLNEANEVEYIIQKTADVTDREIAKLALSEIENKFKFMADAIPQLIDTNDDSGKSTYFNKRWEAYTGFAVKELLDGRWREAIHPDDLQAALDRWDRAFDTGNSCEVEIRLLDKEGNFRWHLSKYLPMHDEDGKVIMWVGSTTDIHETKQMVEELVFTNEKMAALSDQVHQAFKKAEAERKTLERFIMQAPAFFCILKGPNHKFELVNDKYQQLFPKRELLGKTVAAALPEVVEQGFIDLLDYVYNTGETFTANEVLVKIDQNNTGELTDVYVSFIYQALYNENEEVSGILVFGNEVTEHVKIKEKIKSN